MKKIREVSHLAGISKRTLQFYDDIGLLSTTRTGNNYRLYDEDSLDRLWWILLYKELGFKLEEIRSLVDAPTEEKQEILKGHIGRMNYEIAQIQKRIDITEKIIRQEGLLQAKVAKSDKTWVQIIKDIVNG